MKKFAFLLALAAVFAMSATAFAGVDGAISELVRGDDSAVGVLSPDTGLAKIGSLYYAPLVKQADVELGFKITGMSDLTDNDTISADLTPLKLAGETTAGAITGTLETTASDATLTYTAVSLDLIPASTTVVMKRLGGYKADTDNTGLVANNSGTVSVDLVPVALDVTEPEIVFYTGIADKATVKLEADVLLHDVSNKTVLYTLSGDAKPSDESYLANAKATGSLASGLTYAVSTDGSIEVAAAADAVVAGPITVYVRAVDGLLVSADNVTSPVVGLAEEATSGDMVASFTVEVKANPADAVIEAVSKDTNLKSDDVNIIVKNKVLTADTVLEVVSSDTLVNIYVVSLDKDGKPLPLPEDVPARLGQGHTHGTAATDPHVNLTTSTEGSLCTVQLTAAKVQELADMVADARGAMVDMTEPMHIDVLSKLVKVDAKYQKETGDKSSSGACSMGAGILALAGLALVLRKRG